MTFVKERDGGLCAAVGGKPYGRAATTVDNIDVHTALTVGGEGYLLSVRTPYGMRVVGRIRGELASLATLCGHDEDVAFIRENNLLPVRRNGGKAHP